VPGFGLPGVAAGVTLTPPVTPIVPGAPTFLPGDIGGCYATGCGFTGWINADYTPIADTYQLEFNVFNFTDTAFQSGVAFDFSTGSGGTPIVPNVIPEPSTYLLLGTGLLALAAVRRRRVS